MTPSLPASASALNPLLAIPWGSPRMVFREYVRQPAGRIQVSKDYIKLGGLSGPYRLTRWTKKESKTAMALKVKKFKDLVAQGTPLSAAAEAVRETIGTLAKKSREEFGRDVQDTLDAYGWLPPDIKREYVRAKQVEILDAALKAAKADPSDPKMLKLALDATRTIGDDKDVGMYQVPKMTINPAQTTAISPVLAALISGAEEGEKNVNS